MPLKKTSVGKNIIYNIIFQCTTLIVPFITTPYVSRILGAKNLGTYSFAMAMVTYFTLVSILGSTTYGQRKVAFYRDDKELVSRIFWNNVLFRLIMSIAAFILYVLYVAIYENWNNIYLIMAIHILYTVCDITWFFQGMEEFKSVGIRTIFVRLISLFGIYVFVKDSNDTWKYALIIALSYLLGSLSMWMMLPGKIQLVKNIHPFEGLKDCLLIFLPSVATQVYMVLDKSMIGWITKSEYANGCYDMSEKIARLALTVVTSLGVALLPRIANLHYKNDENAIKEYVYKAYRTVGMIGIPMMFGLMGVSSTFIPLFLGPGYNDSVELLVIFSALVFIVGESYVIGVSYLVSTEQQNIYTVTVTIAAVVNVLMNLLLIPITGAIGAAIASVAAEFVALVLQIVYCVFKKGFSVWMFVIPLGKYIFSGVIMLFFLFWAKMSFGSDIIDLIIYILIGVFVYTGCLFVLKDELFIELFNKILLYTWKRKINR